MNKSTIYFSYSHDDADWKDIIKEHLTNLLAARNVTNVTLWDDSQIKFGENWTDAINNALGSADLSLQLISESYLNSKFISSTEVPQLLRRRDEGLRIIPIIVRPCEWYRVSWLSEIVVAPRGGQPLFDMPDTALKEAMDEIAAAIADILKSIAAVDERQEAVDAEATPRLPEPTPPQDLIDACAAGDCALYVGAGLSAQAGLPVWVTFVEGLLDWAVHWNLVSAGDAVSHRLAIKEGQATTVADLIFSLAIEDGQARAGSDIAVNSVKNKIDLLYDYLRSVFLAPRTQPGSSSPQPLPEAHQTLSRIQFSAVVTTNFDNLLEETYRARKGNVYTPRDAEPLLDALSKRDFFIVKLYGRLEQPDTVLLSSAQFEDAVRGNISFAQFMETLFFSRTLLFVGASIDGIEDYLKGVTSRRLSTSRKHYALVAVHGNAWQAKASQLEKRYGITVLPYTPRPDHDEVVRVIRERFGHESNGSPISHSEVGRFLKALASAVDNKNIATQAPLSGTGDGTMSPTPVGRLKRVSLENIGPFERLELNLDPNWNILLGDNGVGKSNILKAIAVAITGKDAQSFAGRLVRTGSTIPTGTILLQTDRETYRAEIKLKSGGDAEVISTPGRPLEAEGWLALGFPPLRTVSWERPKGPEATDAKRRPSPEDLIPLINGGVDPRTDKLKQWLVNLDYWNLAEQLKIGEVAANTGHAGRYGRLLDDFFQVVGEVTEGLKVERGKVNAETHEVTVVTDDGEMPFEMISQGTTSLIGWVGVLLQRLYEINPDDADPKQRYALVLMDEIDAHLHPAWQQSMVYHLSRIFPNVQFIATTHSPLIISGMPAHQVFRFVRDENGHVVQKPINPDMTMGRADQILTTELFGLSTTLPPATRGQMDRYHELLSKGERTTEEEQEYEDLATTLQFRVPAPTLSYEQRREEALSDAMLLKQLGERFKDSLPEGGSTILKKADRLLSDLEGRPNS